jgi:hypothetical protein
VEIARGILGYLQGKGVGSPEDLRGRLRVAGEGGPVEEPEADPEMAR